MSLQNLIAATRVSYSQLFSQRILDLLYSSVALNFNMQPQTQSNWCWAATSTSVSHYYSWFSPWTQCKVANGELGYSNCCNSPVPSPCNVSWYLDRALTRTENFVSITGPQRNPGRASGRRAHRMVRRRRSFYVHLWLRPDRGNAVLRY
jgi:hypothetical protein